jgi:hypothetical protein
MDESENNNSLQALQRARDAAHNHSTGMANQCKTAHDKKASELILTPGQQVLLDIRMFTNENKKLAEKWEGPYFVTQVHPQGVVDILKNTKFMGLMWTDKNLMLPLHRDLKLFTNKTPHLIQKRGLGKKKKQFIFHRCIPRYQLECQLRSCRRIPGDFSGPITRSMAHSDAIQQQEQVQQISAKKISLNFIKYCDNSEVNLTASLCAYKNLIKVFPHLKCSPPTPVLHYRDGGVCRDEKISFY